MLHTTFQLRLLLLTIIVWFVTFIAAISQAAPKGHAHNDFYNSPPLNEALNAGFDSVEDDVFWLNGEVKSCHTSSECVTGVTLHSLYLNPLAALSNPPSFFRLEIEVKIISQATKWTALSNIYNSVLAFMQSHPSMQSWLEITFTGSHQYWPPPAGNPSYIRFRADPNYYMTTVIGWPYTWNGNGAIPTSERDDIIAKTVAAHSAGKLIMFSPYPIETTGNKEAVWDFLRTYADYIATDDPTAFAAWLNESPDAGSDAGMCLCPCQ